MPQVSVIMPLYNKAQSVISALNSIKAQAFVDYEVIVINDGSTDGSEKIVLDYIENNKQLKDWKLFSQENQGVSTARNNGVKLAKGMYIAFLDADDVWDETYLQHQVAFALQYPEAIMWGCAWENNSYNNASKKNRIDFNPRLVGYIHDYWQIPKHANLFWLGSTILLKTAFLEIGGFDERIKMGEDIDLAYRMILHGIVAFDSEYCGAIYRLDTENRAMNRPCPLKDTLPYYIEKYQQARTTNPYFRQEIDAKVLSILTPYIIKREETEKVKEIVALLDMDNQKWMNRVLVTYPRLYVVLCRLYSFLHR